VESAQWIGREVGESRSRGLDGRADRFERAQNTLPTLCHRDRVRSHEDEAGATGERLAEDHPERHTARFGGSGDLPDALLAAGLRRQCQRAPQQRPAACGAGPACTIPTGTIPTGTTPTGGTARARARVRRPFARLAGITVSVAGATARLATDGDEQLEAGDVDADDHANVCSHDDLLASTDSLLVQLTGHPVDDGSFSPAAARSAERSPSR